jgi:excisionase family DNA binding protein
VAGASAELITDEKLATLKVYTTGQIGRLTGAACRTVAKWIDSGRLKGYRLPGSTDRRVKREVLIAFLRENGMPTDLIGAAAVPVALLVGLDDEAALRAYRAIGPGWVITREASPITAVASALAKRAGCVVLSATLGAAACRELTEALRPALPACRVAIALADDDPGGHGCYDVELRGGDFAPLVDALHGGEA